jgi:hypothetical protein
MFLSVKIDFYLFNLIIFSIFFLKKLYLLDIILVFQDFVQFL